MTALRERQRGQALSAVSAARWAVSGGSAKRSGLASASYVLGMRVRAKLGVLRSGYYARHVVSDLDAGYVCDEEITFAVEVEFVPVLEDFVGVGRDWRFGAGG